VAAEGGGERARIRVAVELMGKWVGGAEARMRTPVEQIESSVIESSVVEVVGQRLVELEVGDGLGIGGTLPHAMHASRGDPESKLGV